MPKTQEWLARENISRFRQMIAQTSSGEERARLERLLADEEDKLEAARRLLQKDRK
jgi:hypothetical protein